MRSPPLRRRRFLVAALSGLGMACLTRDRAPAGRTASSGFVDVRDFGAVGDGATRDTVAIQAAIDAAFAAGGGVVYVPAGRFLSGTITVKSRVTLHLSSGAVLLGSRSTADYPAKDFPARDLDVGGYEVWALLYAEDAEQIAVEGDGVIDGNGDAFRRVEVRDPDLPTGPRPRMIFFKNCRGVTLRDVTLRESGIWTVHLAQCDAIRISGLLVTSTIGLNQDGIVLDSCRDATVSDCRVDTVDDGIVLKSSFPRPCSEITIRNCVVRSACAGLKLGTQSLGGFRSIAIVDCVLHDCRLGGLKFQAVDGGDLEDVTVRNITMHNVAAPISFRRGDRGFDFGFTQVQLPRPVGAVRNVRISQVSAVLSTDATARDGHTMSIAGLPGHPVQGVTLEDIDIVFPGGGTLDEGRRVEIPERATTYPEHSMFGVLPVYGLWVRHAAHIAVRNVRFDVAAVDARPALMYDDVDDLELTGFSAPVSGPAPLIRLRDVRGALLQGCRPTGEAQTFVRAEGSRSATIALSGNDLRGVRTPVVGTDGLDARVRVANNLRATPPP